MYDFKFASRWNWGKERKKEKVRLAGNVLRNLFRERVYQVSRIRPRDVKNFFGENGQREVESGHRTKFPRLAPCSVRETSKFLEKRSRLVSLYLVESCWTESKWRFISGSLQLCRSGAFDTILRYADPISPLLSVLDATGTDWFAFETRRDPLK